MKIKKIICLLLACVLCVSTLGGCMAILIDPEKAIEGRVNLNAYPDIQKQGDDFIQMVYQRCNQVGEQMESMKQYAFIDEEHSRLYMYWIDPAQTCMFFLGFEEENSLLTDIELTFREEALWKRANTFDAVCWSIFKTNRFHLYDEEIEKVLEGNREEWNIRGIRIEFSSTADEKRIRIAR